MRLVSSYAPLCQDGLELGVHSDRVYTTLDLNCTREYEACRPIGYLSRFFFEVIASSKQAESSSGQ
jgi:hypothetical protein